MSHPIKIVVIGAGAAGLRAAARAKRLLPDANVAVLDAADVISYGACGLPYFVSGDIQQMHPIRATAWGVLRDSAFFRDVKALDVRTGRRVQAIDRKRRVVISVDARAPRDGDAGAATEEVPYDRLVIATGARPRWLPGAEAARERVSAFKTVDDAIRWREALESGSLRSVAIIGGGYIGCELAEAFGAMWGCDVQLIEAEPHLLPQVLDPEMAALVQRHMDDQGIALRLGCRCEAFEATKDGLTIQTNQGSVAVEHAICAVGFAPNVAVAAESGLELGPRGALMVDETLRTSDPNIFAAGDCIEVQHVVTGESAYIPLGSLANRQGRLLGDVLAGRSARFGAVAGAGAVKVFDLNVACAGLSQRAADRVGLPTAAVWGTFSDKAHYYPGDKPIHGKLIYDPKTERLLGLQIVGAGEGAKRVDVFAGLLKHEGTIDDVIAVEHAYAPPYAPAVDPLYVLGCAAANQNRDGLGSVGPQASLDGTLVLDVRTASEVERAPLAEGHMLHIPLEQIRARIGEVPRDRPVRVICARGARSGEVARMLQQAGVSDVLYVGGGVSMRR